MGGRQRTSIFFVKESKLEKTTSSSGEKEAVKGKEKEKTRKK
ncbi:MAG: hypothetical protein QXT88_02495 [Desulfurococcaceae archaeon]